MAILGTMAILIVQAITVDRRRLVLPRPQAAPGDGALVAHAARADPRRRRDAVRRLPALDNLDFAAGAAAGSPVFKATPWIVLATFVIGVVYSLWLRSANPGDRTRRSAAR
jgi:hypothetical protein